MTNRLLEPLINNMIEVNEFDFMFGINLNLLRKGEVKKMYL